MGIFSNLFKHKQQVNETGWRVGGMEDFMMLIRVYYQAVMAANLGISNLAALPDLRVFKQTLHVPTVNNKLGLGEKNKCRKMLMEIYGIEEFFFKEIDQSIKLTAKSVYQVLTKNDWKDDGVRKACLSVRRYQQQLGYSAEWMTSYVYNVVILAKKEPKPNDKDE